MNNVAKILIVDDETFNIDYLEQELEDLDCQTMSAKNGREALEWVANETPDMILLDIMMPEKVNWRYFGLGQDNLAAVNGLPEGEGVA